MNMKKCKLYLLINDNETRKPAICKAKAISDSQITFPHYKSETKIMQ